ncbi:MAG: DUF2281 domain-containing protein [Cyanobacteria bacterium P01_A01_bin.116]
MSTEQLLVSSWRSLPIEKQKQVLEFVEFLQNKQANSKHQNQTAKRRFPVPELAGKIEILGDIVSPIVDEEDWECLK